jgi:hypothetical protein
MQSATKLSVYTNRFTKAWNAISKGMPDHAVTLTSTLLETILRELISENLK